jgi:hypothetical protein
MPRTLRRPAPAAKPRPSVSPSIVDPARAEPFTLEQELTPFGAWVGESIWVPPKNSADIFAETMLRETGPFASRASRWQAVEQKHRRDFTHVREFDLFQASIRLPQGKFFVTVTEQKDFDKITDPIPACVQTRLEEFLNGPGKKWGTKVYYLKPLCVEVGDELLLTTREDLQAAVKKVQDEAFAAYRSLALVGRPMQALVAAANASLALPRALMKYSVERRQKAIAAHYAHYEFERRKLALKTAETHRQLRTNGCTFDEILELTTPLKREEVIEHYCEENKLSTASREQLLSIAAGSMPWFVALSLTISYISYTTLGLLMPPIVVCDPAFVAEMPDARGVLLKIGHFDQVGGVTHVEL